MISFNQFNCFKDIKMACLRPRTNLSKSSFHEKSEENVVKTNNFLALNL